MAKEVVEVCASYQEDAWKDKWSSVSAIEADYLNGVEMNHITGIYDFYMSDKFLLLYPFKGPMNDKTDFSLVYVVKLEKGSLDYTDSYAYERDGGQWKIRKLKDGYC